MNRQNRASKSKRVIRSYGTYQSFLQQQGLGLWPKDCRQALAVREKYKSDSSDRSDPYLIGTLCAEAAANTMICLIHQAAYLLRRQIRKQEDAFLENGRFSERLYKTRSNARWK